MANGKAEVTLDQLREIEWGPLMSDGLRWCLACHWRTSHAPDCWLAAAIALPVVTGSGHTLATKSPLCIDLFCGLGGWAEGFLAEGWRVVGFDIERHDYGAGGYPGHLVLQDVCTIHGSQFREADCIVASPPCQWYSYTSLPFSRGKKMAERARRDPDYLAEVTRLFHECFRLQREACEAAGRKIPMVVENVNGAQPWVGRARWHFGSFYLWGDLPALMPPTHRRHKYPVACSQRLWKDREVAILNDGESNLSHRGERKNRGGSWFNVAHNKASGHGRNPVNGPTPLARMQLESGLKQGGNWFNRECGNSISRRTSSRSQARKAASAQIAKIPLPLARWIAQCYKPDWASHRNEMASEVTV